VRICIDFDDTIVKQDHPYHDLDTPLEFKDGAKDGVLALQRAGHTLVLYSGRANRALLFDPIWNPLVDERRLDPAKVAKAKRVHQLRYRQMLVFIERELPGVFAYIDSGHQGKPSADLYIDDKAIRLGDDLGGMRWAQVATIFGSE